MTAPQMRQQLQLGVVTDRVPRATDLDASLVELRKQRRWGAAHIGHEVGRAGSTVRKILIAEGIETEQQLAYLVDNKCDLLQGFYFSQPIYPEDVADMLRQNFSPYLREAVAS